MPIDEIASPLMDLDTCHFNFPVVPTHTPMQSPKNTFSSSNNNHLLNWPAALFATTKLDAWNSLNGNGDWASDGSGFRNTVRRERGEPEDKFRY